MNRIRTFYETINSKYINGFEMQDNAYTPGINPYQDLYIYYIQGKLDAGTEIPGECFIGNWEEDDFSFLFFSAPQEKIINELLIMQPHLILIDHYHMDYNDWQGGTPDAFEVSNFIIAPPWKKEYYDIRNKDNRHITLDPGVVFGTGTHTTTRSCLEAIELAYEEGAPESVVDLGTGTGVLAIAASGIGCKNVLAVDLNFLAVQTAKRNIVLNNMQDKILAIQGDAEEFIGYTADLVIANIHYDVMKSLIRHKGFLEKKWFILSGLMRSQARNVAYELERLPVKMVNNWEQDGIWHTFVGKVCT